MTKTKKNAGTKKPAPKKKTKATAAFMMVDAPPQDAPIPEAAPETPAATVKAPKADKRPSGLDAAAQVLRDAGEPLACGVMVERMLAGGLWQTGGKTPASTIYAAMLREIKVKGAESRFKKVDRGRFAINA